jgi:proteasome accessory factor C
MTTSPKTAQRLTRILSMLPWVIANPGTTVDEVCDRFGYTKRRLAADLDLVFVCGLPGYGPGDLMVAYIDGDEVVVEMADYFSNPVRLTAPEALSLLASGLAIQSTGHASAALDRALDKLRDVLLPDGGEALVVDLSEPEMVGTVRSGAAEGRALEIVYTKLSTGETTTRLIEPWTVFSTMGNWYVSAYCRSAGGERVFRVDRIQSVVETGERFEPPVVPPAPVVRYSPNEDDVRATISLAERGRWVADYYPVEIVEDDGEWLTVRFSASDPLVAARLLLRLGADGKLVEGPEVGDALRRLRSVILKRYSR